jgi:hypothetical protein
LDNGNTAGFNAPANIELKNIGQILALKIKA